MRRSSIFIPSDKPNCSSLLLISLRDFLPKLRYLSISCSDFIANSPTVVIFALFKQFAARTDNSISFTLIFKSFLNLFCSSLTSLPTVSNSISCSFTLSNTSLSYACCVNRILDQFNRTEERVNWDYPNWLIFVFVLVCRSPATAT